MATTKIEEVYAQLVKGKQTVAQIAEHVDLTPTNIILRLKDLRYQGRAHIAAWTRKPGVSTWAAIWQAGKGKSVDRPVITRSDTARRWAENQRKRRLAAKTAKDATGTQATVEKARANPQNPFSALGL